MHAALLALSLLAAAQEKTYDLKLNAPAKAGQKLHMNMSQTLQMRVEANGQPAGANEEKKLFEGTEEVLASDADGNGERRWSFTKAERLEKGEMTPYGFMGKTVLVKKAKGEELAFTYADGSPVADEDLKGLKEACDAKSKGDAAKAFAPGKPVKVGESWEPDINAVAEMFGKDMAGGIDPAKSKVRFTLTSVETREGAVYGRIEGTLDFSLSSMGPLKLETALPVKLAVDLDVCIDGSSQSGLMKIKGEVKGESDVDAQGQKVRIGLNLTMAGQKSKRLLK
jgi:hypothetical protein